MPKPLANCLTRLSFSFLPRRRDPTLLRLGRKPVAAFARLAWLAIAASLALLAPSPALGQQSSKSDSANRVTNIIGFEDLKKNERCRVEISATAIRLKGQTSTVEVAPSSVADVLTGDDSARLVGGFLGTLTMFAPYSSGRFLSLFRKKLDTLTVQYRDAEGGLHGGILSMKPGQAALLKKQMVDAGAHTSVPIADPAKPPAAPSGDKKP